MLHLDLFSGIGGFAYAADQVWDNVEHIFCDTDKYCQAVLRNHWPESEIYNDIKSITDTHSKRKLQQKGGKQEIRKWASHSVDVVTGGFPCQPFSAAGVRRGTSDERYLWPEMFRVIRLTQPTWVIAENVRGLVTWEQGVVFEQVCFDLESAGYEVQPFIIPAVAVNAPHRRDRIWFIANRHGAGLQGSQRKGYPRGVRRPPPQNTGEQKAWDRDWTDVAAELCSVDNGLPAELGDFTLTKAAHRREQIKAYGNAIVPQVAMEIMQAIKLAEETKQ